jgi:nicotinamide mononucleotide transporter
MEHKLIETFIAQMHETSTLEWLAVIFGVIEVFFAMYDHIWLYPAGIIGTVLSIYLLLHVQLYADSALNVYYLVMSIYGWIHWSKKSKQDIVLISYSNKQEWVVSLSISLVGWLTLYLFLKYLTPSNVPIWDALVSSTAWAGMWLLARRKMENWIFFNVSNLFAVPLLFYKNLPLFAILTVILFIVAIAGYLKWKRIYFTEQAGLLLKN